MREYKVRTVFNNYNLWDDYKEDAVEILKENGIENPTEDQIWDEIIFQSDGNWEGAKWELRKFFDDKTCILMGENERWNGKRKAGTIFTDFMEMYYKAMKDCDYVHIYDINGHLYFKCSHTEGKHYMKESRMDKVIKQLDKLKKESPDTEIILETPRRTLTVKIKDVLIYEGLNGELILDAE